MKHVITIVLIIIGFNLQSFKNLHKETNRTSVKDSVIINFKFAKHYPVLFKKTSSGNIFLSDGHIVYKFNSSGRLIHKLSIPNTSYQNYIIDLEIDKEKENVLYTSKDRRIFKIDANNASITKSFKSYGDLIKHDSLGNYYNLYQSYDEKSNVMKNRLKVIDKFDRGYDYKLSGDLGANNFIIYNSNILLYTPLNHIFLKLPVIGNKHDTIKKVKLDLPSDRAVNILSVINGNYFFQYYDYSKKTDIIEVYDKNFKFLSKRFVIIQSKLAKEFIAQDIGDWLTEFPSGNIYFCNAKEIFLLRNSETKTIIYRLSLRDFYLKKNDIIAKNSW